MESAGMSSLLLFAALGLYSLAELAFFLRMRRLRRLSEAPTVMPKVDISRVLDALFAYFTEAGWARPELTTFLLSWFPGSTLDGISRAAMEGFLASLLMGKAAEELTPHEAQVAAEVLGKVEQLLGYTFPLKAEGPSRRGILLTRDPLRCWHYPLVFYVGLHALCLAIQPPLVLMGFRRRKAGCLTYWHRPGYGPGLGKQPVVFFHGISPGGLLGYFFFMMHLVARCGGRALFLVEIPEVSMKLCRNPCTQAPPKDEVVASLVSMLAQHRHPQACLLSHSYGSVYANWLLDSAPEVVGSTLWVEPVVFLLFLPNVVGFLYCQRKPFTLKLVRSEFHVANTLQRHFWWPLNLTTVTQLPPHSAVLLSGCDEIVPSAEVRDHLSRLGKRVVWYPRLTHGSLATSLVVPRDVLRLLQEFP